MGFLVGDDDISFWCHDLKLKNLLDTKPILVAQGTMATSLKPTTASTDSLGSC